MIKKANVRCLPLISVAALLVLVVWTSACGDDPPADEATADEATPEVSSTPVDPEFVAFDAANFGNSTVIDNEWAPMIPGTQWVVEGLALEEGIEIPHRIEFTITDLRKEIQGVRTVVAWIVDIAEGEVVEKEIAFYAQDKNGNVWYFGEHPEEYKDGAFVTAPTWIAGIEEAQPGLKMWSEPQVGMPATFRAGVPR
jgi:hypothetical protein